MDRMRRKTQEFAMEGSGCDFDIIHSNTDPMEVRMAGRRTRVFSEYELLHSTQSNPFCKCCLPLYI